MNRYAVICLVSLINTLLANIFLKTTVFELLIFEKIKSGQFFFSTSKIQKAYFSLCQKLFSYIMVLL